jgi:hypothetical protein
MEKKQKETKKRNGTTFFDCIKKENKKAVNPPIWIK